MNKNRQKSTPSTPFQKKRMMTLRKQGKSSLKAGEKVYILNGVWYRNWKKHIKNSEKYESPGPIDNDHIVEEESDRDTILLMKQGLIPEKDYKIISFQEWRVFKNWYDGGPMIQRYIISEGDLGMLRTEVYLIKIPVVLADDNGMPTKKESFLHCSKYTTVSKLCNNAEKLFKIPMRQCRLWVFSDDPMDVRLLSDPSETLDDILLADDEVILIEKKRSDGWPRNEDGTLRKKGISIFGLFTIGGSKEKSPNSKSKPGSSKSSDNSLNITAKRGEALPGLCGLNNLGNTCFMNSGVQCLSNIPEFKEYFISNSYKNEINTKNIIGMGGNLANQYGALVKAIWQGNANSVAPRSFKKVISKYAPQFSGMNQHDAQELIGFLLDGLHEDLNRVLDKPYVEEEEANGRNDSEFAVVSWENHLQRNQSVVVDLFHGQLKSTVECPDCGKVSVKFDPFMYLSVPLSQDRESMVEIILVRAADLEMPKKYAVLLKKNTRLSSILDYLADKTGIEHSEEKSGFFVTEILNSKINNILSHDKPMGQTRSTYVIAYEKPTSLKKLKPIKLLHRKEQKHKKFIPFRVFAIPFISYVQNATTGLKLYKKIFKRCSRFMVKRPEVIKTETQNEVTTPIVEVIAPVEVNKSDDESNDSTSLFTLSGSLSSSTSSSSSSSSEETERGPLEYSEAVCGDNAMLELLSFEEFLEEMPWTLHHVTKIGTRCAKCDDRTCKGCLIKPNDSVVKWPGTKTFTIAISWTPTGLKKYYSSKLAYSIDIDRSVTKIRRKLQRKEKGQLTLEGCVRLFTMNEQLGESDKWYCSDCEEFREAFKKFDLWTLPRVLIVQLKRFVWLGNHSGRKNSDYVNFPLFGLDFDEFLLNEDEKGVRYNLTGVVTHSGGLSGGHYTAYCRNETTKEWYYFNDSRVTQLKNISQIPEGAYVLFYVKDDDFEYSPAELALKAELEGKNDNSSLDKKTKKKSGTKKKHDSSSKSSLKNKDRSNDGKSKTKRKSRQDKAEKTPKKSSGSSSLDNDHKEDTQTAKKKSKKKEEISVKKISKKAETDKPSEVDSAKVKKKSKKIDKNDSVFIESGKDEEVDSKTPSDSAKRSGKDKTEKRTKKSSGSSSLESEIMDVEPFEVKKKSKKKETESSISEKSQNKEETAEKLSETSEHTIPSSKSSASE